MRSSDLFFYPDNPFDNDDSIPVLNEVLVIAIRKGTLEDVTDLAAANALLDLAEQELHGYGTDGIHQLSDSEMGLVLQSLKRVTQRLGCPLDLPFRNFSSFRSYWVSEGARGSWQARRDIIEKFFGPVRQQLIQQEDNSSYTWSIFKESGIADLKDSSAIEEHLSRIQRAAMHGDPMAVIGSAKELVESTAKVVLSERGWPVNDSDDLPGLVSKAQTALRLHPQQVSIGPDDSRTVKKILGGLMTITIGLAELRNQYGTGHGATSARSSVKQRHAQLAVNSSITWCQLLLDTLRDPSAPWRSDPPQPSGSN